MSKPGAVFVCALGNPWISVREQNERETRRLTLGDVTLSPVLLIHVRQK